MDLPFATGLYDSIRSGTSSSEDRPVVSECVNLVVIQDKSA